jgi:hypothetical protein
MADFDEEEGHEGEERVPPDDMYDEWRDRCMDSLDSRMYALNGSVEDAIKLIEGEAEERRSYYYHRKKEMWETLHDIAFRKCFEEKDAAWLDLLEACSKNEFLEVL